MSASAAARLAGLLVATALAPAQEGDSPAPPPPLVVRCVDGDGKPVAGAEVHVFQAKLVRERDYEVVPSAARTSDADGRVSVERVMLRGGWHEAYVYARVPGKLVGAHHGHPMHQPEAGAWTVELEPSRTLRGRVVRGRELATSGVVLRVVDLCGAEPAEAPGLGDDGSTRGRWDVRTWRR